MFYVAKLLWGIVQPSTLIGIVLLAGAVFLLRRKNQRFGRFLLISGTLLYAIAGFSPLGNLLLIPLETRFVPAADPALENSTGIIVLGGAIGNTSLAQTGSPQLNEAAERMTDALRLANRFPGKPIVFSGGSGALFDDSDGLTEAELARQFFAPFGLTAPRLVLEDKSRNTLENAVFTAKLLRPEPNQSWVLLTSAFHMQRAKALFEAQGFVIVPWPVDYRTNGVSDRWTFFTQGSEGLRRTDLAAKEWLGFWVARLRGDIL